MTKKIKYVKKDGAEELRKYTVSTRMNEAEIKKLDFLRGSQSRGNYIRTVFFGDSRLKAVPEINIKLYRHINQTTANLNQLAKHFNKYGLDTELIEQTRETLNELRRLATTGVTLVKKNAVQDEQDEAESDPEPDLNKDF